MTTKNLPSSIELFDPPHLCFEEFQLQQLYVMLTYGIYV
jgi:hypothetical protein